MSTLCLVYKYIYFNNKSMYLDGASTSLLMISKSKCHRLFEFNFVQQCANCVENQRKESSFINLPSFTHWSMSIWINNYMKLSFVSVRFFYLELESSLLMIKRIYFISFFVLLHIHFNLKDFLSLLRTNLLYFCL